MRRALLGALLALCIVGSARAQVGPQTFWGTQYTLSTTATNLATTDQAGDGLFNRTFLAIDNPSATINVACAFNGIVAAVNTGGSWMIPAGSTRIWPAFPGGPVPQGSVNCIAASGSPTIAIVRVP